MDAMVADFNTQIPFEIDVNTLKEMADAGAAYQLVDVREGWEVATCSFPNALHIPMQTIPANTEKLALDRPIIVVCHHGMRSLNVMSFLRNQGFHNATSLRGGIDAWAKIIDRTVATY